MANTRLVSSLAAISMLLAFPIGSLADQTESAAATQPPLPKLKAIGKGFAYPDAAKRIGVEGKVILGFDIAADGRATNISLLSSDDTIFEKPAMDLLKGTTFECQKVQTARLFTRRDTAQVSSFACPRAPWMTHFRCEQYRSSFRAPAFAARPSETHRRPAPPDSAPRLNDIEKSIDEGVSRKSEHGKA